MPLKRIVLSGFFLAILLSVPIAAAMRPIPAEVSAAVENVEPVSTWIPKPATTPDPTPAHTRADPENLHVQTGLREDGTFDSGTLFIGDSLTRGLVSDYLLKYELIGDAMYAAIGGHAMQQFFLGTIHLNEETKSEWGCVYSPQFYQLSLKEAVELAGADVTTLYFMMGTNGSTKTTPEIYTKMLDYLTECCPNATIFMQTVPYSHEGKSDHAFVNENLRTAVKSYTCNGMQKVYLIDTFTAIGDQYNTTDGIHLIESGNAAWYDALIENDAQLNPKDTQ